MGLTVNRLTLSITKILSVKKSWESFRICLLNSTASSANFHQNWAGLTVLFSRQVLNNSQDFFLLNILILIYFFRYETIETHARAFMTVIILPIAGGISCQYPLLNYLIWTIRNLPVTYVQKDFVPYDP